MFDVLGVFHIISFQTQHTHFLSFYLFVTLVPPASARKTVFVLAAFALDVEFSTPRLSHS